MDEPTFVPAVFYRDPKAALAFLEQAFGFEVSMAIEGPDDDPSQCHYEMTNAGAGRLMIGGEWADWINSPASNGGTTSQTVHVAVTTDIDDHCARAREAGATITFEPKDEFYGDRVYRAADPEGHSWTFHMHVRDVPRAEAEAAIGQPIDSPGWA